MTETIESVLEFWFGKGASTQEICAEKQATWWQKNPDFDREVTQRFESTTESVASGKYNDWLKSDNGILASIIALDQFPRNMYRDTPRAFEFDSLALELARQLVDSGRDKYLISIQRCFAYLPFEHSESLADQNLSLSLYQLMVNESAGGDYEILEGILGYAVKHREVIERFGRFPHRNEILGRESTQEELAFLQTPGSSF